MILDRYLFIVKKMVLPFMQVLRPGGNDSIIFKHSTEEIYHGK